MPQPAQSVTASASDRRIDERVGIQRSAVLRIDAHTSIPVTLVDLTRDGCLIESDVVLTADQRVELGLAGIGAVTARVVRSSTVGYGCEFIERLPPGAVTSASQGNVVRLQGMAVGTQASSSHGRKLSPRQQVAAAVGVGIGGWVVLGAVAALLLR
ncbi:MULTISPECIES: PilZ domain-containing protein [unclassified Sphingomonas]|uniref:PilZ domain-containing protein n=1 Tax=unclassified Sphingomonas TaxID=196159 RepID=UPI0006FF2B34|nr:MULTISPECIES: PilZ domain-containing protein [unclassified Sphingomonas]